MNQIRKCRREAGLDLEELAEIVGVDLVQISMAEYGVGLIPIDIGIELAKALSVEPEDLFPEARAAIRNIGKVSDNLIRDLLLRDDNATALIKAGLDPDITPWFASIRFKSGSECKLRLSSLEMKSVREMLVKRKHPALAFLADCRHILMRSSSVAEIIFTNSMSYAPFSSYEDGDQILIGSADTRRPERVEVSASDDEMVNTLKEMLHSASLGRQWDNIVLPIPAQDRLIAVGDAEYLAVPVGILMPSLYEDPEHKHPALEDMTVQGTA